MSVAVQEKTQVKVLDQVVTDRYSLYHGDSCEVIKGMPDNSIGYSIFSPPFASLYTYSNSDRDMGNCSGGEVFSTHFKFLVEELFRVMKPGRLLSFHCMDMPASLTHDGFIGLKDFPGELARMFDAAGFILHSKVCIWKDPVTAMQRTKALGLLHKTVKKDSSMSRNGIPDMLVTVRKPGKNEDPIAGRFTAYHGDDAVMASGLGMVQGKLPNGEPYWFVDGVATDRNSIDVWQRYASPVWMDINPSDTLQRQSARDSEDERHICLAKGSMVLTYHDGHKPIEDLVVGKDLVLTHKGRWMPVIAKAKTSDSADVVSVSAAGVSGLRVTPDHKLWARQVSGAKGKPKNKAKKTDPSWVEAQNLDKSYVNLKLPPVEVGSELTDREWWVVGRWMADGHLHTGTTGRTSLHISAGIHKLDHCVSMMGDMAGTQHEAHSTCTQIRVKDPDKKLRNILEKCGKYAHEKSFPAEAFRLNQETARHLVEGFLSGDGHHDENTGRWYVTSTSKKLVLDLQILVQRVYGVTSTIAEGRPDRQDSIMGRTVNCHKEWVLTFKTTGFSHSFMSDDGAWKKVKSVTPAGTAETWNIQVLEDASYTAEGCIVKNCPLQLGVIRRALQLWSNPGDTVLDPFNGISSTGVVCMDHGRNYVGIELKQSYYEVGARNLAAAANQPVQQSLF